MKNDIPNIPNYLLISDPDLERFLTTVFTEHQFPNKNQKVLLC